MKRILIMVILFLALHYGVSQAYETLECECKTYFPFGVAGEVNGVGAPFTYEDGNLVLHFQDTLFMDTDSETIESQYNAFEPMKYLKFDKFYVVFNLEALTFMYGELQKLVGRWWGLKTEYSCERI